MLKLARDLFNALELIPLITGEDVIFSAGVINGSSNASTGISLKGKIGLWLLSIEGIQKTSKSFLYQVVDLDIRRQSRANLMGNSLNQRQMLLDCLINIDRLGVGGWLQSQLILWGHFILCDLAGDSCGDRFKKSHGQYKLM